jgi:starch synthase
LLRALLAGKTNGIQGDLRSGEVEKPDVDSVEEEKAKTGVTYNIVFVTSEAAPYSKTGGLADVCGSLPIALAGRGHRVMVISPRYIHGTAADSKFSNAVDLGTPVSVFCFGGAQEVGFYHEYREGVDWVITSLSLSFSLCFRHLLLLDLIFLAS